MNPMQETPPAQRRLYRSTERKVLTGVCGGLGDYFAIDPNVVRVLMVVLSILTGVLPLAYLAMIFILPKQTEQDAPLDHFMARRRGSAKSGREFVAVALIGVGVLLLFDRLGIGIGADDWFPFALVIVGAAVLMHQRNQPNHPATISFSEPSRLAEPATATPVDIGSAGGVVSQAIGSSPVEPVAWQPTFTATKLTATNLPITDLPANTPRVAKTRSKYSRAALGIFVLGIGVLALSKRAFDLAITGRDLSALVLIGLGVLVALGAWLGRPRLLPAIGVFLALFVATTPSFGPVGTRLVSPLAVNEIPSQIELSVGAMAIDLSNVDVAGKRVTVRANVGVGALTVEVPPYAEVEVRGTANVGELIVFGKRKEGLGNVQTLSRPGRRASDGKIVLVVSSGVGLVEVADKGKLLNPLSIEKNDVVVIGRKQQDDAADGTPSPVGPTTTRKAA